VRERNGSNTRVAIEFPEDAVALGDPLGLEQVIENLVENALRYGKEGGEVRVYGKKTGDRVEITVADEGPGIEARHVARLFERFYRADPSRSRERGGSGLGLAIVKHLVDSMGGTVRVESELGKGSRFIVDLPGGAL
jgi:two-component system, OmpR family, phosphate regulon sensor histidine kinase PhoR